MTVLEASFMILLNIVSLMGNTLVCISVYQNIRLRTTTNVYIVALAISDLLSAIFVLPMGAGVLISGRWPFGEALCQMNAFFSLFVVYISPVTWVLQQRTDMRGCASQSNSIRGSSPNGNHT